MAYFVRLSRITCVLQGQGYTNRRPKVQMILNIGKREKVAGVANELRGFSQLLATVTTTSIKLSFVSHFFDFQLKV